jgi:hypothetical protein
MRVRQQKAAIDSMSGEFARKYALNPQQQAALKQWFEQRANVEAQRWTDMLANPHTGLEDVMRAARDVRPDDGLDAFMPSILSPEKLAAFNAERMTERASRIQQEADGMVQRLDTIVQLDERQRDQVFGIMARTSRDYDPSMKMEGVLGDIGATPGGDRRTALLSVLRPDQRAAYEAERQRRYDEAAKDAAAMGLTLPENWEFFDGIDLR